MSNLRIFVSITIAIIFFSCKKDSVAQPFNDLLRSGSWTISAYVNEFVLDTSINYTGYTLDFHSDGKMQVQSITDSGNGTWETSDTDGRIFMLIDLEDDFPSLEGKWDVLTMTNTQIELSAGGGLSTYTFMTLIKN